MHLGELAAEPRVLRTLEVDSVCPGGLEPLAF